MRGALAEIDLDDGGKMYARLNQVHSVRTCTEARRCSTSGDSRYKGYVLADLLETRPSRRITSMLCRRGTPSLLVNSRARHQNDAHTLRHKVAYSTENI